LISVKSARETGHAGQPELRSFLCRACNEALTKVVDER
jgi:hypothetical protein